MTQLTKQGDISEFAVSNDTAELALTVERVNQRGPLTERRTANVTLINLHSRTARSIPDAGGVIATCGKVLTIKYEKDTPVLRDTITNESLRFERYYDFRCSSDDKVVVGTTARIGSSLYEGVPPQRELGAPHDKFSSLEFNVSADGTKAVYYNDESLCLATLGGKPSCIAINTTLMGAPSVTDSGEILVAAGTADNCFFKTSSYFSPKPLPGHTFQGQCMGIAYWRPSLSSTDVLRPLGAEPQWVTPATAQLLLDWSRQSRTQIRPANP